MSLSANLQHSPVMFFDSGVGGLSVLAETQKLLPHAPIIYVSDSAAFPYGTKSENEIATRVPLLLGKLSERFHPQLITIACNTASTIALDSVRNVLDIPVVGTVPAIKPAAELTQTNVIGLLGTQATVRQPYIDTLYDKFASHTLLLRHGSPELAPAAEAKMRGETVDDAIYENAMNGLLSQENGDRIDTVILGCTHFPLIKNELAQFCSKQVKFVDGGPGIARRIAHLTHRNEWQNAPAPATFVTTGELDMIEPYKQTLSGYGFTEFAKA